MTALLASPQFVAVLESFTNQYPEIGNTLVAVARPEIVANGMHLSVCAIVSFGAAPTSASPEAIVASLY